MLDERRGFTEDSQRNVVVGSLRLPDHAENLSGALIEGFDRGQYRSV